MHYGSAMHIEEVKQEAAKAERARILSIIDGEDWLVVDRLTGCLIIHASKAKLKALIESPCHEQRHP